MRRKSPSSLQGFVRRDSGYVGYKVSGQEFSVECTKFDKLILVFKDGHYQVSELPEKLFVGPELFIAACPSATAFSRALTLIARPLT